MPDLLARDPHLRVIMITGDTTLETAQSAISKGAFDYLTKPFNTDALRHVVSQASANRLEAVMRAASERSPIRSVTSQRRLAGFSRQVCAVNLAIDRVAKESVAAVLIEGESGTGKEMAARAIHELSDRRNMPFVTVNCAAIPTPVVDGELFGHEMGTLSPAHQTRKGYIELADGGTLFLDEVDDLPESVQEKIAKVLDDGLILRIGGSGPRPVNVRVVAAINTDTQPHPGHGILIPELHAHFADNHILMPPLRKHPDDIEHLAYIFLREKSLELNRKVYGFSEGILEFFRSYTWPGNVRELRNVVERLVMLSNPDTIQIDEECLRHFCFETPAGSQGATTGGSNGTRGHDLRELGLADDDLIPLDELERNYLRKALRTLNFNKTQCAAQLGISRSTLQRKIQQYGLE